uniref:hypothetical protein n=1 Tax=Agathobacter sp. TaxID=2021311 RepID=UPI0040579EEE
MKKISVLLITVLLLSLCGCSNQIQYGGTDINGNTAADVVKMYYECLNSDDKDETSYFAESYKNRNIEQQDITLMELSACEVVEKTEITKSDNEWAEEIQNDYYAYCFVQTSDSIICKEDGPLGVKDEEVKREYSYTLVMETEDSEWKIYDFGYPPHYTVEK